MLNLLSFLSLEPVVFLVQFGRFGLEGVQIQTDLLIWKICHLELKYNESVCSNLTLDQYDDINNEIQTRANDFLMISEWLASGPALLFSFFAGALADIYGCKRFILLPMIGMLISDIGMLINYIFINELPIEFFYIEPIYSFFGGKAVYYLGVYGYGSLTTTPENRATTLARFDGLELVARVSGTLLAPIMSENTNKYANFILKLVSDLLAILYLIFIIKDTPRLNNSSVGEGVNSIGKKFQEFIIRPLIDMFKSIFKIRLNGVHVLIAIQFYMFATYWFVLEEKALKYLYMLKTFEGFTATDYSRFFAFSTSVNAVGLLIIVPIMSKVFHWHDSMLLTICLTTETAGLVFSAFAGKLWVYYVAHGVQLMGQSKYGLVRSLLSKCVTKHETGKVFSALAILAAIMPIIGNPAFRQLYNETLETFPAAEILLAAAILATSAFLNFVVFTQRWRITKIQEEKPISEVEMPQVMSSV